MYKDIDTDIVIDIDVGLDIGIDIHYSLWFNLYIRICNNEEPKRSYRARFRRPLSSVHGSRFGCLGEFGRSLGYSNNLLKAS